MAVAGCTKCIKYMLFFFNFIFWVSLTFFILKLLFILLICFFFLNTSLLFDCMLCVAQGFKLISDKSWTEFPALL